MSDRGTPYDRIAGSSDWPASRQSAATSHGVTEAVEAVTQHRYSPETIMLLLAAMDPNVRVAFSEYTGQWYVEARIEVSDGCMVTGGSEHRSTPQDAVVAYFVRLCDIGLDEYVISRYRGHRREWRWNGAAFREVTRDVALPEPKVSTR